MVEESKGKQMNTCECGNKIDPRDLGEDATQCEWCETPEVPIYKINEYGNRVELFCLGMIGGGFVLVKDDVSVIAPNKTSAELILNDYLGSVN